MGNTRVEKKAVSAVNELFLNQSRKIDPKFETGEKGISFDGNAILFSSEETTKLSYLSSIPVQVKGTEVTDFSQSVAKFYDFDKNTFKNFQYEDGVVIFLVEILKEDFEKTKIFYRFLDTEALEKILNELHDNNNKTKVVELDELNSEIDLDKKFREIAIRRKVYSFKDAKLDTFLREGSSNRIFQNDFDRMIVEDSKKSIELYEYKNSESQFNMDMKTRMMEVLSQNILIDTFSLADIYGKIIRLDLLEMLPEENRNLALLIKARYLAFCNQYKSAREALNSINNSSFTLEKEYKKIFLEVNLDNKDFDKLLANTTLSNELLSLYKAKYLLRNGEVNDFYEMLNSNQIDNNRDWLYMKGDYFLYIGNFEGASKIFSYLNNEDFLEEIKYKELFSKFVSIANEMFFGIQERDKGSNPKIDLLLNEVGKLRKNIEKVKFIEMPGVEELFFELNILLDPEEGLKRIDSSLSNNEQNYDEQYLVEWKIRALFLLARYSEALEYINHLPKNGETSNIMMFKILLLLRKELYADVLEYVNDFFKSNRVMSNQKLLGFMAHMYLDSARSSQNIKEQEFENTINTMLKVCQLDLIFFLDLESTRKKLNFKSYGESFGFIIIEFQKYPDERKMADIENFLLKNNELELAKKLYSHMRIINHQLTDETLALLYLYNDKSEKCLELLDTYSDFELSERLLVYKAEAYNRLNQFRATLKLYKNRNEQFEDFLKQVLVAKMEMKDSVDVGSIAEQGMKSSDINFEINAALALIRFAIDLKRGFQTIEKYVLKNHFNNSQLNVSLIQSSLLEMKDGVSLDTYFGVELKWFKFKTEDGFREIVLIPSEWSITNFDNFEFYGTKSDFKLIVQGITIGDNVYFENKSAVLIEEKPLSIFILHKAMERESGKVGSGKPLTSFTLDLEGDILNKLIEVLKDFDRTEQYNEIKNFYEQFHSPFIYSHVVQEEEMFVFYMQMFEDASFNYYTSSEMYYKSDIDYQISISSIAFLSSLNLLGILENYQNIFIEETQKKWLEDIFSRNLNSKKFGRIGLVNNKELILSENTDEQKKDLNVIYREAALAANKLKFNDIGKIEPKIKEMFFFEESSIQSVIDYERVLLIEDEAIQVLGHEEFKFQVSSIGMLISHHFLEVERDVEKFLDIHIQAINKRSAWQLQKDNFIRITELVENSNDIQLIRKFNLWGEAYTRFFY